MTKKENYIITIDGVQVADGESDKVTLSTLGGFSKRGSRYLITYNESDATGFPGNVTTLEAEGNRMVTMLRQGKNNAQLVIERGQRHLCHYETGYGNIMIGIDAAEIENHLDDDGGSLRFSYRLDLNSNELSENQLSVTVRRRPKSGAPRIDDIKMKTENIKENV